MQLTLITGEIFNVMLSAPAEAQVLGLVAAGIKEAEAKARVEAAELAKTYHLGAKPTPGRGYDDRLTARIGCGATKLREQLDRWTAHGGRKGGLGHFREGTKYIVPEQEVRDYLRRRVNK